jgi:hypothetical protein
MVGRTVGVIAPALAGSTRAYYVNILGVARSSRTVSTCLEAVSVIGRLRELAKEGLEFA